MPQSRSPISWVGGKSRLTDKIIPLIPSHTCYVEPFAGGAWVLFRKSPSKSEIINDLNLDLVTLYRVIKHHLDEFVRYYRWILLARDEFERFKAETPEALTDIQRAVRFYYLVKMSHGSRINRPTFGTSTTGHPRLNLTRIEEELSSAHLRLSQVLIENLPYSDVIKRYDRPHTFFYIDPPYYGCENDYGDGLFPRTEFEVLSDLLKNVSGKFLLSLNDTPEVRDIFGHFDIREVHTRYSVGTSPNSRGPVKELLILNYDTKG